MQRLVVETFVNMAGKDLPAKTVVVQAFASTAVKNQHAKTAVEVKFVCTASEDQNAKTALEVGYVNMTRRNRLVPFVTLKDILQALSDAEFGMP